MKKILRYFLILLLVLVAYLLFFPVRVAPESWTPPKSPGMQGDFKQNTKLSTMEVLFKGKCPSCEDVAVDSLGNIYGAREDGKIIVLNRKTGESRILAETGGRPLGMHFDRDKNLIVADAVKGLLSISPEGKITVLVAGLKDRLFGFTDDLEVADNGMIYFSDASWKFGVGEYKLDFLEHGANGQLLSYNPATKETKVEIDKLYFANGVAVDPAQNYVLVVETGIYRVKKYWIKGPKAGQSEILIDNLPGFPDGISQGKDGLFWIGMTSTRNELLDNLGEKPFLRKVVARLPEFMKPKAENYAFVIGINGEGKVRYNLQDPNPKFAQISSVQQFGDELFFGSLGFDGVGVWRIK